jgi:hypothetical protein
VNTTVPCAWMARISTATELLGAVLSFFLDQTARLICTSPFRMNSGASGGRIWDSTHLLSSSMSSPCLLSFMLSVGRLNAAMLYEVILDSPTQIKLIVGARLGFERLAVDQGAAARDVDANHDAHSFGGGG